MITLVLLSLVMASTVAFFKSQSRSFANGSDKMEVLQNARYSVSQVERLVRTLGAGVTGQQPMLVYGGASVVAFNTDYTENDTTNFRWAVNFNPSIDSTQSYAWQVGSASVIPSTGYTYPPLTFRQANGALSPAETKIFWFQSDTSTARSDDYALWERTNNGSPELIAQNVLAYPSHPFFEYYFVRRLLTGVDTVLVATGGLVPMIRQTPLAGWTVAQIADANRPDSVRAVRINIRVTNGKTGTAERTRDFSQIIQVPNNGLPTPTVCGRSPLPPAAVLDSLGPALSGTVYLRWTPSPDQNAGEGDVWQYVVYVRPQAIAAFTDPLLMIKRDTSSIYQATIGGLTPGTNYVVGVSAMDCTPSQSTIATINSLAP
jgi:hypothetical protein